MGTTLTITLIYSFNGSTGGGGGGYATKGDDAQPNTYDLYHRGGGIHNRGGSGGDIYGDAQLSTLHMGSGVLPSP